MTDLKKAAQMGISLMDLTTLNDDDTDQKVIDLCHKAKTPAGNTAAICIYPRFIPIARKTLNDLDCEDIKIATVTNFPHGNDDIAIAVLETRAAVAYGADEVDVVFPYRALMGGNETVGFELVKACKEACGDEAILKVIIESALWSDEQIIAVCSAAVQGGADFVKTSTGFHKSGGASIANVQLMRKTVGETIGVKASGGIRTYADAIAMIDAGASRIGASASRIILAEAQ